MPGEGQKQIGGHPSIIMYIGIIYKLLRFAAQHYSEISNNYYYLLISTLHILPEIRKFYLKKEYFNIM